jgi:YcxB-like protein
MDSAIQLSFRYSELDYVLAMRTHYASRLRLKLDAAVAVVAASLGIYLWQSPDSRLWGIGLVCLSVAMVLMLVAAFGVIPRLVFRREPKFRDEYWLTFSPESIHFRTAHINSQLQWSMYSRALVSADSFILYYGTHSFTVIPKRVFETSGQLAAFEQLVSEKIPEISKKKS